MLRPFRGVLPRVHPTAFIDDSAQVIGDVEIGDESSVWMSAVVRGDVHRIRVGKRTNLQDGTVVHVMNQTHPTTIGDNVTVGHAAVLHGCTIEDLCLIGMGAILLNGCHIGTGSIVAAGTLVVEDMIVPPGCGFRVGNETREWKAGEAWVFDDTIEHEAWNESDQLRVILMIDVWNPHLSESERAMVSALLNGIRKYNA